MDKIIALLKESTVKIGSSDDLFTYGTGFFIKKSTIITCYHVVSACDKEIPIFYNDKKYYGTLENYDTDLDIAIIYVSEIKNNKCVFIDNDIEIKDDVFVYGYSTINPNGDVLTLEYLGEGKDEIYKYKLQKFKGEQVAGGLSGSPILNLRTLKICGIIKQTRNKNDQKGGFGIPISLIYENDMSILKDNIAYHNTNDEWNRFSILHNDILFELDNTNQVSHFEVLYNNTKYKINDVFIEPNYHICTYKNAQFSEENAGNNFIEDCLSILKNQNILIINGPYGSGKTICMKNLQHTIIKENIGTTYYFNASDLTDYINADVFFDKIRFLGSKKTIYVFIDSFEETSRLRTDEQTVFEDYLKKIIRLSKAKIKFVINLRNILKRDKRITDIIYYENIDSEKNEMTYLSMDYFSGENVELWLKKYFELLKNVTRPPIQKRDINLLNKNLRLSCKNPILLFLLAETYVKNDKDLQKLNLFDLYNFFVDSTINGKFSLSGKSTSSAIKEIVTHYKTFLKKISIEIVNYQKPKINQVVNQINSDEMGDILLDSNEIRFSIPSKDVEDSILMISKDIIPDDILNYLNIHTLKENIFVCYFLEKRQDRWGFKDNNILFFFIADYLYQNINELILLKKRDDQDLTEIDINKYYEKLKEVESIFTHPLSLDFLFYKIDELSKEDKSILLYIIEHLIERGLVLGINENNINKPNTDKINLDIWISLLYIHINRASYLDKKLVYFFKRLNWLVSVGKVINKNYLFTVQRFLRRAYIKDVEMRRINCDGYNYDYSTFEKISFIQVKLYDTRMNYLKSINTIFLLCDLENVSMDELEGDITFDNCIISKLTINYPKNITLKFKRCYIKKLEIHSSNKNKSNISIEAFSCDIDNFIFKDSYSDSFVLTNTYYNPIDITSSEVHYSISNSKQKGEHSFKEKHSVLKSLDF